LQLPNYRGPQLSRQNTIHHVEIKFVTAKYNSKQQIQITHHKSKKQLLQFKIDHSQSKRSGQEQNAHGKNKTFMARAKHSWQKQNANGKINEEYGQRLSNYVV